LKYTSEYNIYTICMLISYKNTVLLLNGRECTD
jgi:hypothetical protein